MPLVGSSALGRSRGRRRAPTPSQPTGRAAMPLSAVPSPTLRLLRPSPRPAVAAACCPVCSPQPVAETAVGQAFATFLRLEVAQGAASPDTQRGYWSQVRAWAAWCQAQACCLATAPATAVKTY